MRSWSNHPQCPPANFEFSALRAHVASPSRISHNPQRLQWPSGRHPLIAVVISGHPPQSAVRSNAAVIAVVISGHPPQSAVRSNAAVVTCART
jgi:hypothetical protein